MRLRGFPLLSLSLAIALSSTPALAQSAGASNSEPADAARSASAAPAVHSRSKLFWAGLAIGIAGVATSVVATTVARVEDSSTGNAPPSAYQACVAQQRDPIYATNNCDGLKAKNVPMLASGVAIGAAGAALMIAGGRASAEIRPGVIRFGYRLRF
jgi:hypothetical protein